MKIPLFSGIETDFTRPDYNSAPMVNMVAEPQKSGISDAYIKPTPGIVATSTIGADRGAIYNQRQDKHLRVIGSALYSLDGAGAATSIGSVGGSGYVPMAYGFDDTAWVAGGTGSSYDGATITNDVKLQADPLIVYSNLIDVAWQNQFFFWTDGDLIYQSVVNEPNLIQGFADAESLPDEITGLVSIRDELVVCGRYSIERFRNTGTGTFTFRSVAGGLVEKGVISPTAKAKVGSTFAFIGGGADESISLWAYGGSPEKLATREVDDAIASVDAAQIKLDYYTDGPHQYIMMTLPNAEVWVLDLLAKLWHKRSSVAVNPVFYAGKWWVGNSAKVGYYDDDTATDWGDDVSRVFSTQFVPAEQATRIAYLELLGLWGRFVASESPNVQFQISFDGANWSNPMIYDIGRQGNTRLRPSWRNVAYLRGVEQVAMRFTVQNGQRFAVSALELRA